MIVSFSFAFFENLSVFFSSTDILHAVIDRDEYVVVGHKFEDICALKKSSALLSELMPNEDVENDIDTENSDIKYCLRRIGCSKTIRRTFVQNNIWLGGVD